MFNVNPPSIATPDRHFQEIFLLDTINGKSYLTAFEVKDNTPKNPKVIDHKQLIAKLSKQSSTLSLTDERILATSHDTIVWTYTPKPSQPLFYRQGGKTIAKPIMWPTFIFKKKGGSLSVGVLRGRGRPNANTKVYCAPLPNVYHNGGICMGSCNITNLDDIDAISEEYLNSTKTHLNNREFLRHPKKVMKSPTQDRLSNADYYRWISTKHDEPIRVSELSVLGTVDSFIQQR